MNQKEVIRLYKYETHLHTSPVSLCARVSVKENLLFYKQLGYAGVFITNHFIDGNIRMDKHEPYEKLINYAFGDYEQAEKIGKEIGLKIFDGIESSYKGTDFLVYGLHKDWFLAHPEITGMSKREQLSFFRESGAFVIQAHPFRESSYIDHIRLFPRQIDGVEVINACRTDFENRLADIYADQYSLLKIAGTDNHMGADIPRLAGVATDEPINCVEDFIRLTKEHRTQRFCEQNPLRTAK